MHQLAQSPVTVPLLVEDGKVIQVGWQGRGCVVGK
jgi:glutaredoxin 3